MSFNLSAPLEILPYLFQEVYASVGLRNFLFFTQTVKPYTEYLLHDYSPYAKVDAAFFRVFVARPTEEGHPAGYMFTTNYPVLSLGSSVLAYRQATQQNVNDYVRTASLLLRNPDFLVFGASNSCVLITSQHTHQSLSDALSSNI